MTDEFGDPVSNLAVQMDGAGARSVASVTDDLGYFRIWGLAAGEYTLWTRLEIASRLSGTSDSLPVTTYFPGVGRQDARVVEVGEGERKTGFRIVVSPLSETRVSGTVVFDDDRPAIEANVTAAPVDHKGMIMGSATTDNGGAFELRLLAGVTYLIRGAIRTENGFRQTEAVVFVDEQTEGLHLSIRR